ncbi:MAG: sugar ABC transporter ATP-binding protein [Azospirillaceae bacterium]
MSDTPTRDRTLPPAPGPGEAAPLVELIDIEKSFPGTRALKSVTLDIRAGEVHGIIGENGAGKSTLIKILTGAYVRSAGEIRVDGRVVDLDSPLEALSLGLDAVHQEVVLCSHLTVAENIFLGLEKTRAGLVRRREMEKDAQAVLDDLGFRIDARRELGSLTIGQQQLVATARSTARQCRLLIFDEPTAYLTRQETGQLFRLIRRLQGEGVSIVYISHRLEEVFELCDRVSVLRDGELVSTRDIADATESGLIRDMVNRTIAELHYKEAIEPAETLLEVEGLSGPGFEGVDLTVRRGEIVGLFGLIGAGRSEFVQTVFGRYRKTAGTVRFKGEVLDVGRERDAIHAGIALLPESRRIQGLCLNLPVGLNLSLPSYHRIVRAGLVDVARERQLADDQIAALRIVTAGRDAEVRNLSGGNQQKVVIGKWLSHGADLYIFDEPTVGVDVGTKHEIYRLFARLLRGGAGIILISSYLPEVYDTSDRLIVMYGGRVARRFDDPRRYGHEEILAYAIGDAGPGSETPDA